MSVDRIQPAFVSAYDAEAAKQASMDRFYAEDQERCRRGECECGCTPAVRIRD